MGNKPSKDVLERMYVTEGLTQYQIARKFNVHRRTIGTWLRSFDIQTRGTGTSRVLIPTMDELVELYINHGMSQCQIAIKYNVSQSTVKNWLRDLGINTRGRPYQSDMHELPSKEELDDLYTNQEMTMEQIANIYGVSVTPIRNRLCWYGITIIGRSLYKMPIIVKEELDDLYTNKKMTIEKIAHYYGVGHSFIWDMLHRNGIHVRTRSEMNSGELCYNWKGGISSERAIIWRSLEFRLWRDAVFQRDNYTCQECGANNTYIEAHHIKPYRDYPELTMDPDNGITLCDRCHKQTFGNEYQYICKYEDIVLRDRCIGDSNYE